jgi:PAS domain S-box-containing protein
MITGKQLPDRAITPAEAIADSWYASLSPDGPPVEGSAGLRAHLFDLADEAVAIVGTPAFVRERARALGVQLAQLFGTAPETLGRIQATLVRHLPEVVSATAADPRSDQFATLLGELAAGFFAAPPTPVLLTADEPLPAGQYLDTGALMTRMARLHLVADQLSGALWTTDADLRITSVHGNPAVLTDAPVEQLLGRTLPALNGTSDPAHPTLAAHLRALRGEPGGYDLTVDGRRFRARVRPLRDGSGEVIGCVGLATEHVDQETGEDLPPPRARYQSLIEPLDGIVWEYDYAIDCYRFVSPRAVVLLGHPRDHWLTRPGFVREIAHPDDLDRVIAALRDAGEPGRQHQVEYRLRAADGRWVWFRTFLSSVIREGGQLVRAQGLMLDVTARKQMEERLRHQLSLTQAITSSFRGGLCALDREGRVTFMNPAAEQSLGWRESALLGTALYARVHGPESYDPTESAGSWMAATQQGKVVAIDDAIFTRCDGSTFAVGYTLSPIIEEGVVMGAVLGFRDLTEQKRLQTELTAVNRLLAESREQAQQHLARELHDGALQLLIGISYQLGRRLTVQQDDELRAVRQSVLEVVGQLRALLGELRPAGLEELGLTAALEGYAARLQREAGPQAPEIVIDLDPTGTDMPLPVARCLFRVAQEGLRNALHHARPQRIDLQLRLSAADATLTIRDDGCGFAVPSSLTALTQSNHFGLVGMAERVALAGGQLSIRSQIGRGTAVLVHLPLAPATLPGGHGQVELTSTLVLRTAISRAGD